MSETTEPTRMTAEALALKLLTSDAWLTPEQAERLLAEVVANTRKAALLEAVKTADGYSGCPCNANHSIAHLLRQAAAEGGGAG